MNLQFSTTNENLSRKAVSIKLVSSRLPCLRHAARSAFFNFSDAFIKCHLFIKGTVEPAKLISLAALSPDSNAP
jgi:hypothetical protein